VLFAGGGLTPRALPTPVALSARALEVAKLVRTWDETLGRAILADNVYLDRSREHRKHEAEEIFAAAGEIRSIDEVVPQNQLRGSFVMRGAERDVRVTFTQTPERPARVQHIELRLL
jgi:hypothetical protein